MSEVSFPFVEILKSIPGVFGIRLEEEPAYEVEEKVGDVEVRRYAPALLAEITVEGEHEQALDVAFDRLARYLFGANSKREHLSMTNPVFQGKGGHLPMTAPVIPARRGQGWTVAFFLSNKMSVEEAPRPDDAGIRLIRSPEHLIASLRYRGNNTEGKMHDARAELLEALKDHPTYEVESTVYWAQYDAPYVIPFVKRNEAHVELSRRPGAAAKS
jgi:SOUL heme-binding protein